MTADVIDRPAPARIPSGRLQRMPGLEGVRAVAVTAVLLFHANPNWLPGGFLGVAVFFTLSGFLITSLLLSELEARGGLRLGRFYQHRARRLLPALVLVLVATSVIAMTVAQDAAARVREDLVAAALYVTNWGYVMHGTPYFEATGRPPLLQHLWSLAVEEQFYLVWPLLLYLLWRFGGVLGVRGGAVAGVLASTTLMAWIAIRDGVPFITDSGRVYFGTDTHAMTLLVGAILATYWTQRGTISTLTPQFRRTASGIGVASLVGLVAAFRFSDPMSWALYRGGFLWAGLLTAGVVAAAAVNGTGFARALAVPPLRWIGQRSYGIYLWHWPIFMVLRPGADLEAHGWPVQVARVALTLLAAALSYRYVELPVRRGALGRVWTRLKEPSGLGLLTRRHLAVAATVCTVIALGVGLSLVREPPLPAELRALAPVGAGQLTDAGDAAGPSARTPAAATPTPRTSRSPRAAPAATPTTKPERNDKGTASTTAVGDSVMLAASAALGTQL